MKNIYTRKLISIVSIALLAFTVVFCLFTGKDVPQSVDTIITALIGFLGYYFGKSTALETPNNEN